MGHKGKKREEEEGKEEDKTMRYSEQEYQQSESMQSRSTY